METGEAEVGSGAIQDKEGIMSMNNRWRQIAKMIKDKGERWEYICGNKIKPEQCPCCGGRIYHNNWSYESGCVETISKCKYCKYTDHWSYGRTYLKVGNWDAEYGYNEPEEEVLRIQTEFSRQIRLTVSRQKKIKKKMYA